MILLNQYTPTNEFVKILSKSFNKQLEMKSFLSQKIKTTGGGEKLMWIKKYNGLFIHSWGYKEKIKYN